MNSFIDTFIGGAKLLNIEVDNKQAELFYKYWKMLAEWNQKFNLTAITEDKEVIIKHFLDSLTCTLALPLSPGLSVIDVGTGAGFPGIPLLIKEPGINLTLLDSLQKRTIFLKEVVKELGLPSVKVVHGRAEDYGHHPDFREKYDLAVTRAVARLSVIAEYCLPLVKLDGIFLAMKGPDLDGEFEQGSKALETLGGGTTHIRRIVLPFTGDERRLLLVSKNSPTPKVYPRRAGTPAKKPM